MQLITEIKHNLLTLLATTHAQDRNIKRHAHGLLKRLQELNPQDND